MGMLQIELHATAPKRARQELARNRAAMPVESAVARALVRGGDGGAVPGQGERLRLRRPGRKDR